MSEAKELLIKRLYDTKEMTDLVITLNSVPYKVYCLVLGMTSTNFEDLFLSKEQGMEIELDMLYISQDELEHVLKYSYGWELDMDYAMPMSSLSILFECNKLLEEWKKYRL
jgi:hypothetical protein